MRDVPFIPVSLCHGLKEKIKKMNESYLKTQAVLVTKFQKEVFLPFEIFLSNSPKIEF